jgi:hypothetical protein
MVSPSHQITIILSPANAMTVAVHGVMYGEAVERCDDASLLRREFKVW